MEKTTGEVRPPFCECEECVAARKWIVEKTGVGGGTRPLSFLIASHEYMASERESALTRGRKLGIEEAVRLGRTWLVRDAGVGKMRAEGKERWYCAGCERGDDGEHEDGCIYDKLLRDLAALSGNAAAPQSPTEIEKALRKMQGEMECADCGDTWSSGKLGVCPDCGAEALLPPEGESDWTPCLTCWLGAHAHSPAKVITDLRGALKEALAERGAGVPELPVDPAATLYRCPKCERVYEAGPGALVEPSCCGKKIPALPKESPK